MPNTGGKIKERENGGRKKRPEPSKKEKPVKRMESNGR